MADVRPDWHRPILRTLTAIQHDTRLLVPCQDEDGEWMVLTHDGTLVFDDEAELRRYAAELITDGIDAIEPGVALAYEMLADIMYAGRQVGTHWVGCWRAHPECAVAIIEQVLDGAIDESIRRLLEERS